MKYKAGDKVKIKSWEVMEKEYGLDSGGSIKCSNNFISLMEDVVKKLNNDRIITIKEIYENVYYMKELSYNWTDDMIEYLYKEPEPILSRFEILDL